VPRFGEDSGIEGVLFRMVVGEAEGRALTPAAQTCASNYLNTTQNNGDKLANATNACEDAANRTQVSYTQNSNSTVSQIRLQLLNLEQNLQLCRNETDSALFRIGKTIRPGLNCLCYIISLLTNTDYFFKFR